jgi:hypothetical protein
MEKPGIPTRCKTTSNRVHYLATSKPNKLNLKIKHFGFEINNEQ